MVFINSSGPKCPVCNKIAIKLVAMEDNGQGEKVCQICKKKIKKSLPIEKFKKINMDEVNDIIRKAEKKVYENEVVN